ncbi:2-hydroxyacid dehydrogenase [Pseudoduganella albidiflava]|uniref:Dehydrogenase n=1 Tax=Pseudoduganella albidiflava TaxID=321983 RepID=A0A411WZT0_9BURK|nr:2-hydroxyacid dehydrogenase [Pseudoduganella albidiflava]QBI02203.1 2-hydroxyacid dehydrogenase [Pseudoduganella albidiflava]GGY59732.1 dehydrogenase [Pseudoduganella albidiflava]
MKPEILVMAASPSMSVMAQLEQHFVCHHVWQVAPDGRAAFIAGVAPNVRGVATTGMAGIGAALAAQLPRLEIVAVNGIGVDAVDFAALRPRGIRVTNTPGVLTDDVADLAVALLLAAARRIPSLDRYVRAGQWQAGMPVKPARALRGKVAGIYGFGRIGQAVAARLAAFGLQLRYWQPNVKEGVTVPRAASLLDLARDSDYLVVCAPGGAATRATVDAAVLDALGPEGTLVNIARGSLVDEPALADALADGRLGAAALDVFADEPSVPAALTALPNVVLTPHVGSLTVETRHAMGQLVVDNLLAHFGGMPLLTPVA